MPICHQRHPPATILSNSGRLKLLIKPCGRNFSEDRHPTYLANRIRASRAIGARRYNFSPKFRCSIFTGCTPQGKAWKINIQQHSRGVRPSDNAKHFIFSSARDRLRPTRRVFALCFHLAFANDPLTLTGALCLCDGGSVWCVCVLLGRTKYTRSTGRFSEFF